MTPIATVFSESIGLALCGMETSELWIGEPSNPLISSAGGSPASPSVSPASGEDRPTSDGSGQSLLDAFAYFDPATSSLRMCQGSLFEGWEPSSGTWPASGMMQNGRCFPLPALEPPTSDDASGLWPTPVVVDSGAYFNQNASAGARLRPTLGAMAKHNLWPTPTQRDYKDGSYCQNVPVNNLLGRAVWPTPSSHNKTDGATGLAGGSGNRQKLYKMLGKEEGKKLGSQSLNPYWVEWLMGFPLGWTDCVGSATRSSRK